MLTSNLIKLVEIALTELDLPQVDIVLEHPANECFGDYSTNVALLLYPLLVGEGKNKYSSPHNLGDKIVKAINLSVTSDPSSLISAVNVAGPGFINFTLASDYLLSETTTIISQAKDYGKNQSLNQEQIVVEFTDPNPFKEFHIGHLYSNSIGECLSRLLEASGANIWRADYFGDIGVHVAKAIWVIYTDLLKEPNLLDKLDSQSIIDRQQYLGQCYVKGAQAYDSDPNAKIAIDILNTHLYPISQKLHVIEESWQPLIDYEKFVLKPEAYDHKLLYKIYRLGRKWSLEYFETLYERLGTKFNGYYPESKVGEIGYQLVMNNLSNNVFQKSQDAIIFKGEKFNLHTRVFINKHGLPTYEAKELGLAPTKYQDFPYTKSFIITGNEINDYFKVLLAALMEINPALGQITTHIGHGMVRLPEGKMSSRSGNVVTGDNLMNQAKNEALKIINSINPDLPNKDLVSDQIGIGAIKYAFLKNNLGDDFIFKISDALSFTGNSGPYLQYTHARCHSVIKKSKINSEELNNLKLATLNLNPEELTLLRWFYRYPEVIDTAANKLAPHLVCTYLYELAQRYNTFYNQHTILGSANQPINRITVQFRLLLTAATAQILKNGLKLLGLQTPPKM